MPFNRFRVGTISTHAPYTEGDLPWAHLCDYRTYFNSRPLYRGRQVTPCVRPVGQTISTHAPYTEGDWFKTETERALEISTHAPYTEGDIKARKTQVHKDIFQLTPPIQRATISFRPVQFQNIHISTHAPYTEGDFEPNRNKRFSEDISTHAPYTEGDIRLLN